VRYLNLIYKFIIYFFSWYSYLFEIFCI
jgi:hypothetical protein